MSAQGADQAGENEEEGRKRLIGELIQFNLEAAPEPPGWARGVQLFLALLCIVGAFGIAAYMVCEGPPAPKAAEVGEDGGGDESGAEAGIGALAVSSAPPETAPSPGNPTTPNAPDSSGGAPPGGDAGGTDGSEGQEEGATGTDDETASLNEEAPWAFAIVGLIVGAFLAAGQSLGFGSGGGGKATEGNPAAPSQPPAPSQSGAAPAPQPQQPPAPPPAAAQPQPPVGGGMPQQAARPGPQPTPYPPQPPPPAPQHPQQ